MPTREKRSIVLALPDVFYATETLETLITELTEELRRAEFLDDDETPKKLNIEKLEAVTDGILATLLEHLSDEEDSLLAQYLKKKFGMEFDDGSVAESSSRRAYSESERGDSWDYLAHEYFRAVGLIVSYTERLKCLARQSGSQEEEQLSLQEIVPKELKEALVLLCSPERRFHVTRPRFALMREMYPIIETDIWED